MGAKQFHPLFLPSVRPQTIAVVHSGLRSRELPKYGTVSRAQSPRFGLSLARERWVEGQISLALSVEHSTLGETISWSRAWDA